MLFSRPIFFPNDYFILSWPYLIVFRVENAIEATQNFNHWLVTNHETYLLTSVPEVNFQNAYPGDPQTVVQGIFSEFFLLFVPTTSYSSS